MLNFQHGDSRYGFLQPWRKGQAGSLLAQVPSFCENTGSLGHPTVTFPQGRVLHHGLASGSRLGLETQLHIASCSVQDALFRHLP